MKLLISAVVVFLAGLLYVSYVRADDTRITAQEAWKKIKSGATLVDVRRDDEFSKGHIEGALHIPHDQIETRISELGADKNKEIVLYCHSGRRAGLARDALMKSGFKNVFNAGGLEDLEKSKS